MHTDTSNLVILRIQTYTKSPSCTKNYVSLTYFVGLNRSLKQSGRQ